MISGVCRSATGVHDTAAGCCCAYEGAVLLTEPLAGAPTATTRPMSMAWAVKILRKCRHVHRRARAAETGVSVA